MAKKKTQRKQWRKIDTQEVGAIVAAFHTRAA
jgi:hypothetical protein